MITSMNITASNQDLDRYQDRADLRAFYKDKGIDGLELMLCGAEEIPPIVPAEDVQGIHLSYFSSWLDFWREDWDALLAEYGDRETVRTVYGGLERDAMLHRWEQELEIAQAQGVRYVVFHVSECSLEECFTYRQKHTDEEVCDAACEIIRALLSDKPYSFYFLVENLWWSGFTMTRPEITERLLYGISYEKKGIMLDTGHLLHTNRSLRTQEEAVSYIERMLDEHGELCGWIKGIHLQQSLSGEYVESVIANPPKLTGTYWERFSQVYPHIFQIDRHRPFTAPQAAGLIRRIHPKFLTFELISCGREEHSRALREQLEALNQGGME
ncbi:MAG: TIM barrel protein [Eubacteriales bacterium]|nr:TIM barrel protein [Eubacteriales bacterium]